MLNFKKKTEHYKVVIENVCLLIVRRGKKQQIERAYLSLKPSLHKKQVYCMHSSLCLLSHCISWFFFHFLSLVFSPKSHKKIQKSKLLESSPLPGWNLTPTPYMRTVFAAPPASVMLGIWPLLVLALVLVGHIKGIFLCFAFN